MDIGQLFFTSIQWEVTVLLLCTVREGGGAGGCLLCTVREGGGAGGCLLCTVREMGEEWNGRLFLEHLRFVWSVTIFDADLSALGFFCVGRCLLRVPVGVVSLRFTTGPVLVSRNVSHLTGYARSYVLVTLGHNNYTCYVRSWKLFTSRWLRIAVNTRCTLILYLTTHGHNG